MLNWIKRLFRRKAQPIPVIVVPPVSIQQQLKQGVKHEVSPVPKPAPWPGPQRTPAGNYTNHPLTPRASRTVHNFQAQADESVEVGSYFAAELVNDFMRHKFPEPTPAPTPEPFRSGGSGDFGGGGATGSWDSTRTEESGTNPDGGSDTGSSDTRGSDE